MRALLPSVASVIGGEAAVRFANYVAVLFIARAYGAATLGAYAVTLSIVTVVVMFADSGLQTAAITQLAAENSHRNQLFGQLTLCKSALLAAAAILLAVCAGFIQPGALIFTIGYWLSLRATLQSLSQLQMAALKSISKAGSIGIMQSLHSAILLLGLWLAHQRGWGISGLLAWVTAAQLVELLLAAALLLHHGLSPSWPRQFEFLATLKIATPFCIAYGLANLIIRADTIVLSRFVPLPELGAFSAANSLLLLVYLASWLFGSILLPEMVRLSPHPGNLKQYTSQWARRIVIITIPGALLASLLAPKVIVDLYGSAFSAGGILASIMFLACPLILLNSIYTTSTIASNRRAGLIGTYATTALVTLFLDFFLGRTFGVLGITAAIVIREATMFLVFWLLTSRVLWPAGKLQLRPSSEGN